MLLLVGGLGWIVLTQMSVSFPKAGIYNDRIRALPVQETYSRQQVRDLVWDISASRWAFPEQETYTRQEMTNIVFKATMNSRPRDGSSPPVLIPAVLMLAGAFMFGVGTGKRQDVKKTG